MTGVSTASVRETQRAKSGFDVAAFSTTRGHGPSPQPSLHFASSQVEAGVYHETAPIVAKAAATVDSEVGWRDNRGLTLDQDIALANPDPRNRDIRSRQDQNRLGMTSNAVADGPSSQVPQYGIEVSRDWRLDCE